MSSKCHICEIDKAHRELKIKKGVFDADIVKACQYCFDVANYYMPIRKCLAMNIITQHISIDLDNYNTYKAEWKRLSIIDSERPKNIVELLKERQVKIAVSDIAAFLKDDLEKVKNECENLYKVGIIDFAGNGRYFILSDKKKAAKTTSKKSDATDVKAELKKYKQMLEEGLITQEQYDAKSNELLGL